MCLERMDARKVGRRGCGEGGRAGLSAHAAHKVPPDEKAKPSHGRSPHTCHV